MLFKQTIAVVLLTSVYAPGFLLAQNKTPLMKQEYFVQQAADESLLIRIDAFEAEFESRISEQGGRNIALSAIPGSRIVPVFQYINAQDKARQLEIEVTSNLHTSRSDFGLGLTRISVWDDRSDTLDRAYQLLSFGMLASNDESAANWTVKIDSLINASRVFQQFGMKEMRLWSTYLAAHLIQSHLHDHSIVFSMCREILAEVKDTRLEKIELAALRLQSEAMIGLKRSGFLDIPPNKPDPVQSALAKTAILARSMGFYFEQAQTLNISGAEYVEESDYASAIIQYQQAVEIADLVGDAELATGIRERIVEIHAIEGNVSASSAVLQEIEIQLLQEGGDELALNLLAQGRLLIRSYHYLRAYEVLSQALIHQNDSAIRRQVNFELAKLFYATGRLEKSKTYLQLAEISINASLKGAGNSIVDIGEGLRILASIYRSSSDFAQMRKAREVQGEYRPDLAQYRYEQGLDELAPERKNLQKARSLLVQSQQAASASGQPDIQQLALLQLCALENTLDQNKCLRSNARAAYDWLKHGGVPRHSVEAMYLWAKILANGGRRSDALGVLDRLVSDIHFYRHSLPGVLGSWYRHAANRCLSITVTWRL